MQPLDVKCLHFNFSDECTQYQFTCNNTKCVSLNLKCDRHDDCGDRSDEDKCGILEIPAFMCC